MAFAVLRRFTVSRNVRYRNRQENPGRTQNHPSLTDCLASFKSSPANSTNTASLTACLGTTGLALQRQYAAYGLRLIGWSSTYKRTFSNACITRATQFAPSTPSSIFIANSRLSKVQSHRFTMSRHYSRGVDLFSPGGVLWTLIGTNVAVYFMWNQLDYRFMEKHFTLSINSILNGRIYTVLTSAFSQMDADHLLSNMIGLYFFGSEIGRIFGAKYLLMYYLGGAIGGALGHMVYCAYVYPWLRNIPRRFFNVRNTPRALGASGAVTTIMLLNIFLYPKRTILFQMFIPMPAALLGAIIIGRDLWLARQGDSKISVGGHLGGAFVAFVAYLRIRSPWL